MLCGGNYGKQTVNRRPRIPGDRLISLLSPFFSNYSTNIKRFADKLANLGKACRSRAPVRSKACFMDDLLREFLTETGESLDTVDNQLVRFEHDPNNAKILDNIFRLAHTIKGTCGFLGLPRLEALTHAAEALMGNFRDGASVPSEAVSLILATIDRIKMLLDRLERTQAERDGEDQDLISQLSRLPAHAGAMKSAGPAVAHLVQHIPAGPAPAGRISPDE